MNAAFAGEERPVSFADVAGRWTGQAHALAADRKRCGPKGCQITLDIVPCGKDYCGIEVAQNEACGAVALNLAAGSAYEGAVDLAGKMTLAAGSTPYVVQAVLSRQADGAPMLSFVGDTGSELMLFRRSFPFHMLMTRSGSATCTMEKATS